MLKLNSSTKFRKDYKTCIKRGYNLNLLETAVETLRVPAPLPEKNKDYKLTGHYTCCRECHLLPDWLLIYRIENDELYLIRTGSHAELFNKW